MTTHAHARRPLRDADGQLAHRIDDAAALIGVSSSTIRRLIARGALPTVKVGGCVLIRHDDLHAMLERARAEPLDR